MWYQSEQHGVGVAFTDVVEGNLAAHTGDDVARVAQRRRALETALRCEPVRYVRQVHGTVVADVTHNHVGELGRIASASSSRRDVTS